MTSVLFDPNPLTAFQFPATLDGGQYTIIVTWNSAGQRWYINIYDQNYVVVATVPLINSPPNYDISLTAGYFTSTLIYRKATMTFEVSP